MSSSTGPLTDGTPGSVRRRQLRDDRLDAALRRDGYVVIDAAAPADIDAARAVFERYPSGIGSGYYASIHSHSPEYKALVHAELTEILWPGLDRLLEDYRSLIAAFMVKEPVGDSVVPVHQDWNTMEESEIAGLTCWMPLTPVSDLQGRFRLLPGSHRHLQRLRGSPGFPAPWEGISEQVAEELMVDVEVGVGQVLVMDGRVLHTTPQNRSGERRIAAYINALPVEIPSVHYYRAPDGSVEAFAVDDAFYTRFNIGERPPGEPFRRWEPYEEPPLTMDSFRSFVQPPEVAGRQWWRLGRRGRSSEGRPKGTAASRG